MRPKKTKEDRIKELHDLTGAFCKKHLTKELNLYVDRLIDLLSGSDSYDVCKGNIKILASGVVCVIARLNFLFEKKNKSHISIEIICKHFDTKKMTIEKKAGEIEAASKIMLGHEGLCAEEISDALVFLQFENGMIITKAMAKQHGII